MFVIACLGNPGKKYAGNRHNIGFITGTFMAEKHGCSAAKREFSSHTGKITLEGQECLLVLPQTYMNRSGSAVAEACAYFRVEPENLIVVHDELELPFGEVRHKKGGGHRGHNGLRSIMEHVGSPDFHRVRFGIGRPPHPDVPVADWVLSDFFPEERSSLQEALARAEALIADILAGRL
jgi:PTH1 family peptidyl-tRNA hydrolase